MSTLSSSYLELKLLGLATTLRAIAKAVVRKLKNEWMAIPVVSNVRGVLTASVLILGLGIFATINNSKDKKEYQKSTGIIQYYDIEFRNLPSRNQGDYRYLQIDTYPYVFEIFEPNGLSTEKTIDDLSVGDEIDIYYYETADTRKIGLNRFTQFIDKNGQPYFVRGPFQKQLGYVIIGLSLLLVLIAFVTWKKKMLEW